MRDQSENEGIGRENKVCVSAKAEFQTARCRSREISALSQTDVDSIAHFCRIVSRLRWIVTRVAAFTSSHHKPLMMQSRRRNKTKFRKSVVTRGSSFAMPAFPC